MIAKGKAGGGRPTPSQLLMTELLAEWVAALEATHARRTVALYTTHAFAHFVRWEHLADVDAGAYIEDRLRLVARETVKKEVNSLRTFLGWCVARGFLVGLPVLPKLPKSAMGVRDPRRKEEATELSPAEVEAWLGALPEWSARPSTAGPWAGRRFPVRDWYLLAWETALRPSTLSALAVPRHYGPSDPTRLRLTKDIDKARYNRPVPLTARAQAILARHAPEAGLIFGTSARDLRRYLKPAAEAAGLPPHKVATLSPYDLRHARATDLVHQTGDIAGTAYLLGHKHLTTTDRYAKGRERHAEGLLASLDKGGGSGEDSGEG